MSSERQQQHADQASGKAGRDAQVLLSRRGVGGWTEFRNTTGPGADATDLVAARAGSGPPEHIAMLRAPPLTDGRVPPRLPGLVLTCRLAGAQWPSGGRARVAKRGLARRPALEADALVGDLGRGHGGFGGRAGSDPRSTRRPPPGLLGHVPRVGGVWVTTRHARGMVAPCSVRGAR